jgi:WD40 repeat protein
MGCEKLKSPWIVLTFSPDGKILASSNALKIVRQGQKRKWQSGKTVELWHVPSLKLWKRLPEGQGSYALAFSPDRKILAVGRKGDNCVSLWKLPEGRRVAQLKPPIPKSRFSEYVRSLAFSPDGKLLAVGTRNGLVHLYRLPQGKLLGSLGPILISEEGRPLRHDLTVVSLAFSPDGKKLAVLLEQGDVLQLWRVPEGQLIWQRKQDVVCFQVAFAKRGKEIVGAGYNLLRCNAADGKVIAVQHLFESLPGSISADGEWVAVWKFGGEVKVYRSSDFKEVWRFSVPGRKLKLTLLGWAQKIEQRWGIKATRWLDFSFPFAFGFAFSPDKRWLALGFDDGSIRLWKIR